MTLPNSRTKVITMDYIGGVLTKNSYKFPTKKTKPFVKFWMQELAEKITVSFKEEPVCLTYEVSVRGLFTDERRPDIQNLFEVISDAVQAGLSCNDKFFQLHDGGYELGHFDQKLIVAITPGKAVEPPKANPVTSVETTP